MIKTSDIINKVFTKSFMGYDVREVDAYLDEIIDEIERLQKERLEMAQALEQLLIELDRYEGKQPERISDGRARIEQREAVKRLEQPSGARHIAVHSPARVGQTIPEDAARAIVEAVALEIETGAAAPRRKAVAADVAKAARQEETAGGEKKADLS